MNEQLASSPSSRRKFIKTTAATTAILGFPAITRSKSPNSKLGIGLIGVGGRGRSHVAACRNEQVVALCDVNKKNLDGAARFPWCKGARTYKDFRDFYEKIDDIDAVVVSTTEHTHAFATLPALQAKKHVYCEKPLTRDVHECRIITEAAAKAGVQTQMGTQIHSGETTGGLWNSFNRVRSDRCAKPTLGSVAPGGGKVPLTTPQGISTCASRTRLGPVDWPRAI